VTGDLYFLEATRLYRLSSAVVDSDIARTGWSKDVYNRSDVAVDGIDITVEGVYTASDGVGHEDGTPPPAFPPVPSGPNTILRWSGPPTIPVNGHLRIAFYTSKLGPFVILGAHWKLNGVEVTCPVQASPKIYFMPGHLPGLHI